MTDSIRDLLMPWARQLDAFQVTDTTIAGPTTQKLFTDWLDDCIVRGLESIPLNSPRSERKDRIATAVSAWHEEHSFVTVWTRDKGISDRWFLQTLKNRVLSNHDYLLPFEGQSELKILILLPYGCADDGGLVKDAHKLTTAELQSTIAKTIPAKYNGLWNGLFHIRGRGIMPCTQRRLNVLFNLDKTSRRPVKEVVFIYAADGQHYDKHETEILYW